MIKAVICDLDETLLMHDKTISQKNLEVIQELSNHGIYFIPATGRPYHSIQKTLKTLNLYNPNDYSITYNGGMIHHNQTQSQIEFAHLSKDTAKWLFDFGLKHDVCMHIYQETITHTYNNNDEERAHCINFSGMVDTDDATFNFIGDDEVIKVLYQNLDIPYLESIYNQIPESIQNQLEASYSSSRYLEFNPIGVSKGTAVRKVLELLNLSTDEVLTIGDNLNDKSMLEITHYSGVPSNANPAVKEVAGYVSPKSFDEDAVSDIIKHFIKL